MRKLRVRQHQPRHLPPLRQADLIWLRRITAIILIATAMWLILAAAVGLELHCAGMP